MALLCEGVVTFRVSRREQTVTSHIYPVDVRRIAKCDRLAVWSHQAITSLYERQG